MDYGNTITDEESSSKTKKNNDQTQWVVSCDGEKLLYVIMLKQRGYFGAKVARTGKSQHRIR